jgi:hypothetical protein
MCVMGSVCAIGCVCGCVQPGVCGSGCVQTVYAAVCVAACVHGSGCGRVYVCVCCVGCLLIVSMHFQFLAVSGSLAEPAHCQHAG